MPRIFISYRRDDSASNAGRIYDRLEGYFGQGQVFMDVDTIKPGVNFLEVVEQAVGPCDGLVAVIGGEWLQASDSTGSRLSVGFGLEALIWITLLVITVSGITMAPTLLTNLIEHESLFILLILASAYPTGTTCAGTLWWILSSVGYRRRCRVPIIDQEFSLVCEERVWQRQSVL